jgi:hypothetical protein
MMMDDLGKESPLSPIPGINIMSLKSSADAVGFLVFVLAIGVICREKTTPERSLALVKLNYLVRRNHV